MNVNNPQKEAIMKNITQNATILLVILVLSISVSGTALFAQEQASGSLLTASDLVFVESNYNGSEKQSVAEVWAVGSLINGEDLLFIKADPKIGAKRYPATTGQHEADHNLKGMGVITNADYLYLIAGM